MSGGIFKDYAETGFLWHRWERIWDGTNTGMSGVAAAVMAGRLAGQAGKAVFGQAVAVGSGSPNGGREGFEGPQSESSGVVEGQPIPMQSEQDRKGGSQESFQANPGAQGMSGTFSGTGVKHESGEAETEDDRRNHTGKETGEGRKAEREKRRTKLVIILHRAESCRKEPAPTIRVWLPVKKKLQVWKKNGKRWKQRQWHGNRRCRRTRQLMIPGMMSIQEEADIPDAEEVALSQNPDMGTIQQEGTGFDRQEGYMPEEIREQGTEAVNPGAAAAVGFVDAETAGTGSIQHKPRSGIGESPERISGKPYGRRQGGTQERGSMVESPEGVSGESIGMDVGKAGQSAERFVQNGKLYLDAERYEAPEIPYRMESRYGGTYYTVPQSAAEGRIEASLREDGSVRYQKNSGSGWEPKRKEEHPEQQGQEDGHGR